MGGVGDFSLVDGVGFGGRAMSRDMSRGDCGLRKSSGSLSDGYDCVLTFFLFVLSGPSTGACRLLGGAPSWC